MARVKPSTIMLGSLLLTGSLLASCSKDKDEHAGSACAAPGDCYKGLKTAPKGEILCLTRVEGGYCTHLCTAKTDCCAVEGECKTGIAQTCAPFESTGQQMCFLSCEPADIGTQDGNAYCQQNAHKSFLCRSTGGGSANQKVCVPSDSAAGPG
jgi:hypothetical protein